MPIKLTMLMLLIISGVEIFFNIITKALEAIISLFAKNYKVGKKLDVVVKLITIVVFLVSVIYFLSIGVGALAKLLDIPLDKSLFDIFR